MWQNADGYSTSPEHLSDAEEPEGTPAPVAMTSTPVPVEGPAPQDDYGLPEDSLEELIRSMSVLIGETGDEHNTTPELERPHDLNPEPEREQ